MQPRVHYRVGDANLLAQLASRKKADFLVKSGAQIDVIVAWVAVRSPDGETVYLYLANLFIGEALTRSYTSGWVYVPLEDIPCHPQVVPSGACMN